MTNLIVLSARDVSLALTDPFGLWHNHHGDQSLRDVEDQYAKFLKEQGLRFEKMLLASRHQAFVDLKEELFDSAADKTDNLLKTDRAVIYGGAIRSEQFGLRARPDVIKVHDGVYLIEEYKLAGKPDDAHKIQALFYMYLLIKGYGINNDCKLVTRKNEEFVVSYDEVYIEESINRVREILASKNPPHPVYNCQSEWGSLQNQMAKELQDVSLARNVGPIHAKKLHQIGIHSIEDLAKTSSDVLKTIKGLGAKKIPQILDSAKAQVTRSVLKIGVWGPKDNPPDLEIFIDLEGSGELFQDDPAWNCIYLIGLIPRSGGQQVAYISYVAKQPSDERSIVSAFLEYLRKETRSYRLYHWHHYERTQLEKACERHGEMETYQSLVLPYLEDLCREAQDAFVLPIPSWSIKEVAPYFGFKWSQDAADVDAMKSAIMWYEQAVNGGSGVGLDRIIEYNKDDCMAMLIVKDAFDKLNKEIT